MWSAFIMFETPDECDNINTLVTYIFESIFTVISFHSSHRRITVGDYISYGCDIVTIAKGTAIVLNSKISTLSNIQSIIINYEQDWRI